jgi:transposase
MQGEKKFEPKLFYGINLVDFLGRDHFLVRLDKAVSLEWIRRRTKSYYSHTGKPSIDPVVLVKMLLIGYLYDIRSERRLVEEISLNLAYRWYVGYDLDESVPDHSIFTKARARFGKELFLEIFEEILAQCVKAELVKGDGILVDSTIVRADASMDSVLEVSLPADEYWRKLDDSEKNKSPRGMKPKGDEAIQVGSHFKGDVDKEKIGKRRRSRKATYLRKRSTTDPDATVFYRYGMGTSLSYKAHVAADTSGIITAVAVSPSADHDTTKLPELLEKHEKNLGTPPALAGDAHYGSNEALTYLHGKDIRAAVPYTGRRREKGRFAKERFIYDEEDDTFICPAGKALSRKSTNRGRNLASYVADPADCACCEMREECMGKSKAASRTVTRGFGAAFEDAERFSASAEGLRLAFLRHTVLEGLLGEAKVFHGMSRAKMRGIDKMEIQLLLTATALNLKRLVKNGSNALHRVALNPHDLLQKSKNIFTKTSSLLLRPTLATAPMS